MFRPEISELYKYRRFDEYTLQSLTDGVIWVSSRENLNDPFDMRFDIEPDLSYVEARSLNTTITPSNYVEKQIEFATKLKTEFPLGGIYCLSETNTNNLMWSHYTDSHKGFCVGYERSEDNLLGADVCKEVIYGKFSRIKLTDLFATLISRKHTEQTLGRKLFEKLILTKSTDWAYEKEWRILFKESDQLVEAPARILSVTFGFRCTEEHKKAVRELLHKQNQIIFYQAETMLGYQIQIRKC